VDFGCVRFRASRCSPRASRKKRTVACHSLPRSTAALLRRPFAGLAAVVETKAANPPPGVPASFTTGQRLGWPASPERSETRGGGWECAAMKAPPNYRRPGTIDVALIRKDVALIRKRATGAERERIGSGRFCSASAAPAGPASPDSRLADDYAPLNRRYDPVSFDPHGAGGTATVKWGKSLCPGFPERERPNVSADEAAPSRSSPGPATRRHRTRAPGAWWTSSATDAVSRPQPLVATFFRCLGTCRRYGETVGSPSIQNLHGTSLAPFTPVRGPLLMTSGSAGSPA